MSEKTKTGSTDLDAPIQPLDSPLEAPAEGSHSELDALPPLDFSSGADLPTLDSGAYATEAESAPPTEPPPELSTQPESTETSTPTERKDPAPAPTTLELLKEFAERTPVGKPAVQAEFPFSLSITGRLTAEEKEKLLDLIKRENMGIMESDLEPQLQAGKILIPRISEYAGVLLVQALRAVNAEVRLGPSDSIYSTEETRSPAFHPASHSSQSTEVFIAEPLSDADRLPITNLPFLPEFPHFTVLEVVTASGALKSTAVEAETSPEYQTLLEGLQKELKHKAFHKGAVAIINFQVQLSQLGAPTHYRLTVTGSAIRGAPKPLV